MLESNDLLAEESVLNSKDNPDGDGANLNSPRILIVEDNALLARALSELLQKQEYETFVSLRGWTPSSEHVVGDSRRQWSTCTCRI